MSPKTIVIADDHPLIIDALSALLETDKDIKVVARCVDGAEALQAVRRHRPNLLILDVAMPTLDGLGVLRALARSDFAPAVVVLTRMIDEVQTLEALKLGVAGIVLKETASQVIGDCVRKVLAGGRWLENDSVKKVVGQLTGQPSGSGLATLTARELQVAQLAGAGLRNAAIARKIGTSEGTVKVHLHNIYEKLGIGTRDELIDLVGPQRG